MQIKKCKNKGKSLTFKVSDSQIFLPLKISLELEKEHKNTNVSITMTQNWHESIAGVRLENFWKQNVDIRKLKETHEKLQT